MTDVRPTTRPDPVAAEVPRPGPLSPNQAAVAALVSRSHATAVPGFAVMPVEVANAQRYARAATRRLKTLVGLPELVLRVLGAQRAAFPRFFATVEPDGRSIRPGAANIGVTVDVGTGLLVPVLHQADRLGLGEISGRLLEYRRTALHGRYRPAELDGATIMLALNTEVAYSRPIVFAGQTCALSLGAGVPQVRRDPGTGRPVEISVVHLGLAHDHRVLNGREVGAFLAAIRDGLEGIDSSGTALDQPALD